MLTLQKIFQHGGAHGFSSFSSVIFGVNLGAFLGGDEPKQVEAAGDVMRRMGCKYQLTIQTEGTSSRSTWSTWSTQDSLDRICQFCVRWCASCQDESRVLHTSGCYISWFLGEVPLSDRLGQSMWCPKPLMVGGQSFFKYFHHNFIIYLLLNLYTWFKGDCDSPTWKAPSVKQVWGWQRVNWALFMSSLGCHSLISKIPRKVDLWRVQQQLRSGKEIIFRLGLLRIIPKPWMSHATGGGLQRNLTGWRRQSLLAAQFHCSADISGDLQRDLIIHKGKSWVYQYMIQYMIVYVYDNNYQLLVSNIWSVQTAWRSKIDFHLKILLGPNRHWDFSGWNHVPRVDPIWCRRSVPALAGLQEVYYEGILHSIWWLFSESGGATLAMMTWHQCDLPKGTQSPQSPRSTDNPQILGETWWNSVSEGSTPQDPAAAMISKHLGIRQIRQLRCPLQRCQGLCCSQATLLVWSLQVLFWFHNLLWRYPDFTCSCFTVPWTRGWSQATSLHP